ncbi:MAG: hypothetical protein RMJ85_02605 [Anaerolineales bacterium]|nr:hypothetical protein [Anaerolineales bacterium]
MPGTTSGSLNPVKERQPLFQTLIRTFKPVLAGTLLFVGLAHHLLNLWEQPGLWILAGLFTLWPLSLAATQIGSRHLSPIWERLPRLTRTVYLLAALLLGGLIAWRTYHLPETYQTLTITAQNGPIALVEIKNDDNPLSLEEIARESTWQIREDFLQALPVSAPLRLNFRAAAGKPIELLLLTSPESGSAQITLNGRSLTLNLREDLPGQTTLRLYADYRGLPGLAFRIFLLGASLFSLASTGFALLLLQHVANASLRHDSPPAKVHRRNLLLLLLTGLCVYTFNALTIPLILNPDSHGLLQGSFHLLKYGNLDGVSMYRGPGSTFLFAPVLWMSGNNAWGLKILLHLFALASIFPAYRLGWQLSHSPTIGLLSGLLVVLSPDLLSYTGVVMSDVPNIFFVLTFLSLLISALQDPAPRRVFGALLTGSFAVLLRAENLAMLALGALWLLAAPFYNWKRTRAFDKQRFGITALATLAAALPILAWSAHNQRVHGFFGMSNYGGEVLYDGWVYYGDALGTRFSHPDSPAIQAIQAVIQAHPITITDPKGVPTGWEIYPAMLAAGYTSNQAFDLMGEAALDSIRANPLRAAEILFHKYQHGLTPRLEPLYTYPLPGEPGFGELWRDEYFYQQTPNLPRLIALRRALDDVLRANYPRLAPIWVSFTLTTVFLSFFRRPWPLWSVHTLITASRILLPLTLGVAFWRYALAGWIPAQITALAWLWLLVASIRPLAARRPPSEML